jgi:hypothetical protein
MQRYKVRTQKLSAMGFLTQADHYKDYELDSPEPIEEFAANLALKGFFDRDAERWIMPGAIVWIERA